MCRTACANPFAHLNPVFVDLPCGCQDVRRDCGCVCREHEHVVCDGAPAAPALT